MNLDRYEKINGREALRRLADGETIYDSYGTRYEVVHKPIFDEVGLYYTSKDGGNAKSRIEVSVVLSNKWYIPKPFNVRQAMREHEDVWVGAFGRGEQWYKVGFDSEAFCAVHTALHNNIKNPNISWHAVNPIDSEVLDECIPIEDVPEMFK